MDIELKGTLRHKGKATIPDHYATFGIYNEYDKGVGQEPKTFISIGVKEGSKVASVDIRLEELERMMDTLYAASRTGGI